MYFSGVRIGAAGPPSVAVPTCEQWRGLQRQTRSLGRLGDDISVDTFPTFGSLDLGGADSITGMPDSVISASSNLAPISVDTFPTTGSLVEGGADTVTGTPISSYTPTQLTQAVQSGLITSSQVASLASQAGLTAAQIAAMQKAAPAAGAVSTAAAAGQVVSGVSNVALLFGGAIVLMLLASGGKKR